MQRLTVATISNIAGSLCTREDACICTQADTHTHHGKSVCTPTAMRPYTHARTNAQRTHSLRGTNLVARPYEDAERQVLAARAVVEVCRTAAHRLRNRHVPVWHRLAALLYHGDVAHNVTAAIQAASQGRSLASERAQRQAGGRRGGRKGRRAGRRGREPPQD